MSSGSSADNHHHHHHHPPPTVAVWWPQGCCLERSFTKSEKKIGQIRSGATGTVPSALRSRGQCALESPRSMLRVARTCPQSAARTTGRAIQCVVDRPIRFGGQPRMTWRSCTAGNSYISGARRARRCCKKKSKNGFSRAAKPLRRPKCRCGGAAPALSLIRTTPTLLHSKVGPIFCY